MTDLDDDTPLAVTMTSGEWQELAEVLERALDVVLECDPSPRKRQNVHGLVVSLKDLHDRGVYVEAIYDGTPLYGSVAASIESFPDDPESA